MPCYNEANHIRQSINSVFKQSFKNIELIIVDDGSSDSSVDIIENLQQQFSNLILIKQSNRGAGPARNHGLKHAHCEMIAFLDADDSWDSECLQKLYNKLISSPDSAIAYCGWQNTGLSAAQCKPYIPPDYEVNNKIELLLRSCPWPIHASLTRRSAINNVNGFDEQWTSCMDYDLWLRIASNEKVILVPEVLAFYNHHDGVQITKNRLRVALNHRNIQLNYLKQNQSIKRAIGHRRVRELVDGESLHRAYLGYWKRDLDTAYVLFRIVLFRLYFNVSDLKYILPSLLPRRLFKLLVSVSDSLGEKR